MTGRGRAGEGAGPGHEADGPDPRTRTPDPRVRETDASAVPDGSGSRPERVEGSGADRDPTDRPESTNQTAPAEETAPAEGTAPAGESDAADWDPTGLDLARSVVGSLVNGSGPTARRGAGGVGGGPGSRNSGHRSGSRSRRFGEGGVAGQAAYADIAGGSGAHPDDRDPQALDNTIDRLVADRGWNTDVAVAGALSRWDQIVGPQIAEHCRAERYADGVLTVRADSTAWATQVRLLAAALVRRLNEDLGDGTVDRIVVQGPTGYDWRKRGLGTRDARGPRDTFG